MSKKRERTPDIVGMGPDPMSAESLLFQLASDMSTVNPHQPKILKTGKSVHGDNGSNNSSDGIDESIEAKADASSTPVSIANEKHPAAVSPSSTLRHCDGLDVVRKGSRGRGRQLMVLPGVLGVGKSATGGKLGVLKNVTSAHPILYVEFSEGRLKCTGRIIHTKGRFFTLYADKAANKATRMDCRDVFDSVVFFSKACWVGKAEDNPSEEVLPLPESLQSLSEDSTESGGKNDFRTHFGGGKPYSSKKAAEDSSVRGEGGKNEPKTECVPAATEGASGKQARRSSRSTKSTVTYVEDSDDFEGGDGVNDGGVSSSSDLESVKGGNEESAKEGAKEDKPGDADVPEVFSILDAPTAERKPATVGSGRDGDSKKMNPSKRNRHSSGGRSKGKKRRALSSSESEDGNGGEKDGDGESESPDSEEEKGGDGVAFTPEPSRRSRRASTLSRVKYTQSSGSEEENDNDEEENDDEEEFDM